MMSSRSLYGVLCAIALSIALNPDVAHAEEIRHYSLKRRVIRMTLDRNPLVRVQCTIRDIRGVSETVVWDPAERRGLTRYALLPKRVGESQPDALECVSDRLDLIVKEESVTSFAYDFLAVQGVPTLESDDVKLKTMGAWKSITGESKAGITVTASALDVTAMAAGDKSPYSEEERSVLDQSGGFEQTTSLRSLDPTTTLINDLLGTLATIALERASEAGKQYVRSFLKEQLCDSLTVEDVKNLVGSSLKDEIEKLGWANERRLLQTTCALIDTARIDELASARDAVWRAVAVDATILAGAILEGAIRDLTVLGVARDDVDKALMQIVRSAGNVMRVAISGNTATTERDVQVLILALGRVGLDASPPDGWRCGIEAGIAVLRDCLRDQSCSADDLQRLLEQERQQTEGDPHCDVGQAIDAWPELPTLLGRIADVLRPAPGVDARMTAATAFEVVLDVADHVLESPGNMSLEGIQSIIGIHNEPTDDDTDLLGECKKVVESKVCDELMNGVSGLQESVKNFDSEYDKLKRDYTDLQGRSEQLRTADLEVKVREYLALQMEMGAVRDRRLGMMRKHVNTIDAYVTLWEEYGDLLRRTRDELKGRAPQADTSSGERDQREHKIKLIEKLLVDVSAKNAALKREGDRRLLSFGSRYAYTLAMSRTLRAFVAVLRGEDPAPAIVELATVLQVAILDHCEAQERAGRTKCQVPVTTQDLQRAFAVIGALASYGASYRGEGSGEEVPEELQKQRAEERKKALETVIAAFTDRSQRNNEWVFSLGANVSLSAQMVFPRGADDAHGYFINRSMLALPLGLAYQQLPGSDYWNPHFMVTFIDLGQYLTVSKEKAEADGMDSNDKQLPRPELGTALHLGIEAGLMLGNSSFPISLTVRGAWIPRVTYDIDDSRSEYRVGISAGVFVPFLDLN